MIAPMVFSLQAEAATPKTASGKPLNSLRTAQVQAEDPAPSASTPNARSSAPPRSSAPAARPLSGGATVVEEIPPELHGGYDHPYNPYAHEGFHEGCLGGNCAPCSAGPVWVSAEYIMWWRSGIELPPLVTTSPDGTPQGDAGILGLSTTTVLFGNEVEEYPTRPGGRVSMGIWTSPEQCTAFGGRFYWSGDADINYAASSDGSTILAIPFTDASVNPFEQNARLIGFPATFSGDLSIDINSELLGGDAFARMQWCQMHWGRIDFVAGYQYARLNEGLTMISSSTDALGTTNQLTDSFFTHNEFHGGQLGFLANIDRGCFYVDLRGTVGLGNMQQSVTIQGQSVSTTGGVSTTVNNSGLFVQPTNAGEYSRDDFVVIPELGINLGWRLTECLDLQVGYTFIYFSGVVRPGDAIDTTVNTSQAGGGVLVGAARPAFVFNDSDFVAHGLNLGLTFRW